MQKVIEDVLFANRLSYILYGKGLNTPAQIKKFKGLCLKKPKQTFVIQRQSKSEPFFKNCFESDDDITVPDHAEEAVTFAIVKGKLTYLVVNDLSEEELREELFDEIINAGELYSCELCKEIIRSQRMKCQACSEAYLCTYCFTKSIMVDNSACAKCNGAFLDHGAKSYLEEMVNQYKSDPQALFNLLQKKKKQLPPSLKNIGEVIKSAFGEAKSRGEKIEL